MSVAGTPNTNCLYVAAPRVSPAYQVTFRNDSAMADRIRCEVHDATVRADQREALGDLIYKMFERRHHSYVAGQEKDWLTMEIVQSLRRASEVYRDDLSTQTSGPLPFALGYFQLRDDKLSLTTNEIPANVEPKVLVRLLSEFVRPGARFWFGTGQERGWQITGTGKVTALHSAN